MVHITRQILTVQRIRTTLSENWDHPVFFCWKQSKLSNKISFVGQLEPPCRQLGPPCRRIRTTSTGDVEQSRSLAKCSIPQTELHQGTLHKLRDARAPSNKLRSTTLLYLLFHLTFVPLFTKFLAWMFN